MREFAGKVAVITGGASGIGLAIAQRLAKEGMKLVLADVEEPALQTSVEALRASGADVLGVPTDDVAIGLPVRAVWDEIEDADGTVLRLPQWEPAN